MHFQSHLAWLALAVAQTHGQFLVGELSFGYGARLNPDGGQSVPGFALQGQPRIPEVLSNKVILTPPAPGNQRGAIWSDSRLQQTQWVTDIDFRATGPDRGGGNLNIWLVRDGVHEIGAGSIYTVGRFDGLALVVDQYGGAGGMLRGFLNDGSTDYKRAQVDGLSFGHCTYAYRNRGVPSQIKMRQSPSGFRVEIDGRLCFESDQVNIPAGYQVGITAASADNPDSFEVFKIIVQTESYEMTPNQGGQQQQQRQQQSQQPAGYGSPQSTDHGAISTEQLAALNSRLDAISQRLDSITSALSQGQAGGEAQTALQLGDLKDTLLARLERIGDVDSRVRNIEKELRLARSDMASQVKNSESAIRSYMINNHETLSQRVRDAAPGHTGLIIIIIGSQLLLVVGYVMYERRKTSPKKYL